MEIIRESALEEEMQELQAISEDRTLKVHEKYERVEAMGYLLEYLGSGSSAYTSAHRVQQQEIHSRKYLNGKYLVYGTWGIKYGRGVIYRGYVKLIVPEDVAS